jgi:hypothetical protein
MLPGFRFLFAAIVLSISILVFGLGAAALLRAAHEEFVSNPAWHAAPDATFTQQIEATRPVLAMLRVDTPPLPKPSDNAAAVASPAEQGAIPAVPTAPMATVPVPAEQTATVAAEPEEVAALKPEETSQPVAARLEIPTPESPAPAEAAAASTAADQTKIASAEQGLPAADGAAPIGPETTPAAATQTSAPALPQASIAPTNIATLIDAVITAEPQPQAKTDSATPDRSIIKKRQQARRAARRRRMALRARLAQLAAQQLIIDPFAQPQPPATPPAAVRKR